MWLSLGKGWTSSYCRLPAELHRDCRNSSAWGDGASQPYLMDSCSCTWYQVSSSGHPHRALTEPHCTRKPKWTWLKCSHQRPVLHGHPAACASPQALGCLCTSLGTSGTKWVVIGTLLLRCKSNLKLLRH